MFKNILKTQNYSKHFFLLFLHTLVLVLDLN